MPLIDITSEYSNIGLITAKHLLYYVPRNIGGDEWTEQLLDFKENVNATVRRFCRLMLDACNGENLQFDYVVRMLGSQELSSYGPWPPVQKLAVNVANALEIPFVEHFIRKHHTTPKLAHSSGKHEREEILRNSLYIYSGPLVTSTSRILVVDDITTSGSTIKVIDELVRQRSPGARVGLICLAKTSHNREANKGIQLA